MHAPRKLYELKADGLPEAAANLRFVRPARLPRAFGRLRLWFPQGGFMDRSRRRIFILTGAALFGTLAGCHHPPRRGPRPAPQGGPGGPGGQPNYPPPAGGGMPPDAGAGRPGPR